MILNRQSAAGFAYLAPAALLMALFTYYPAIVTAFHSVFSTGKSNRPSKFIGMSNYTYMFDDPIFWKSLINNIWFAIGTIPTSIGIALVMALWVNRKIAGRPFLRMAYFTPTILPMVAVANIWIYLYAPQIGPFSMVASALGFDHVNFLGDQSTALPAIIVVGVWKEAGFFMIFYLAALQSIPPSLADAAAIEGASRWYFFRRVVFPLILPTTMFILINAIVNAFRMVDQVIVMTQGGPDNATALLLFYIYQTSFYYWDTSYAAALSVVLLAILAALAFVQFGILEKRVHYR
ncbi:carbohydrate ABC transporter permease [Pararhizobium sp. O133]|uniref:carbohydrate ABC transporter permease n=1 Tax=Pararhizobium sp. O133 TaxID=3449278 RepID=UPI003F6856CE